MGDKYLYLTYYVYLVGIEEVIDCKNARSGKLQIDHTETQSDVRQTPDKIITIPTHVRKTGIRTVFEHNLGVLILC